MKIVNLTIIHYYYSSFQAYLRSSLLSGGLHQEDDRLLPLYVVFSLDLPVSLTLYWDYLLSASLVQSLVQSPVHRQARLVKHSP